VRLSRKIAGLAVFALAVTGFMAMMAWALLNQSPVTGKSGSTRLDKPAPEFTLPLFEGGELTLSEQSGRPVVINFWASWCAPCRVEARRLEEAWRSYRDRNVLLVGIQTQDTEADGRAYLSEFGVTYPNVIDGDGKVSVDYGVIGLPVTFFVDRDGIVVHRWVGAIDEARLTGWIDEMVSGATPSGEAEGKNPDGFFEFK
jgi:cytochrome c biogenesis protein CcmG/thiol:disulfide interchange protein DsbE